jgi:hypothetical protein
VDQDNQSEPRAKVITKALLILSGLFVPVVIAACVAIFYWVPMTSPNAGIQWDAADLHYPLQKYFSDHLLSGTLPFWTPYLFSGYPLLANPEMAAWYPLHWPFYLAGITPRSIQLELALHAYLACLGVYLLVSRVAARRSAAVLGAFAYGLSGFFASHSSHVGVFAGAAWFPWLLLAYRRAAESGARRYVIFGGLAGAAIILAGYLQTAAFGFVGLGLYAAADAWSDKTRWRRSLAICAAMLGLAVAVAAIQVLPTLELVAQSVPAADYSAGVLQLKPLLTLLYPDWMGTISQADRGRVTEHYFYAGLLLLPLVLLGVARGRAKWPALALIVPPAWYMLGPHGGLYYLVSLVPGLRMGPPILGWFLVAMGMALLAAAGCDWLLANWRWRPIPYFGIILAALFFADLWYWNSLRNPLAYARAGFERLYTTREQIGRRVAAPQFPLTRFEAPRYLPGLGPLLHPLDLKFETTYGYLVLEPRRYSEYRSAIARNPKLRDGLNVTRYVDFAMGDVEYNPGALPRAYFPRSVADIPGDRESRQALATLDPASQSIVLAPHAPIQQDPEATAFVNSSDEQGYRIHYEARSPSLLKLSVPWYPGWQATMGGRELPVLRVDHALLGVVVPEGENEVEFRFRSRWFLAGLAVTVLALIGIVGTLWGSALLQYLNSSFNPSSGRKRRRTPGVITSAM